MSQRKKIILVLFASVAGVFFASGARAATNVSATTTDHWAWNDLIGWIDFYNTNTVTVSSTALSGYASSSVGDISMDCATTRNGNICLPDRGGTGSSDYQVTNDTAGNLAGWGWNDEYGWISFDCNNNPGGCNQSQYRVWINGAGYFQNYAWNDTIGWISFNCNNQSCTNSDYRVNTSWTATSTIGTLDSTTFDTGVVAGAQLNSVLWQGSAPAGTSVKFQFASSNSSSGPWTFVGTDGTSNSYYSTAASNASLKLDYTFHNNFRYFRYRTFLYSNSSSTLSPIVDDVIVNWSP